MQFLLSCFILISCHCLLIAQAEGIKIYDSDDRFLQYAGFSIQEHDEKLYVLGLAMDTSITQVGTRNERNLHLTEFDLDGNLIDIAFWDDTSTIGEDMFINRREFHLDGEHFYIPYGSTEQDCIVRVRNDFQEDFELLSCDTLQPDHESRLTNSSIQWEDGNIYILQATTSSDTFFVSEFHLAESSEYVNRAISIDSIRFFPLNIQSYGTDTLVVTGITSNFESDNREEHKYSVFYMQLDSQLEILSYEILGFDIIASSLTSQAFLDSEGYILFTHSRRDWDAYVSQGSSANWAYSVLTKVDPRTNEIVWETPMDSTVYRRQFSYVVEVVESHDNNSYVWVGSGSLEGGSRALVIGKTDKNGEVIWRREIADDFQPTRLDPFDVIKTSDGYYMLTGVRVDISSEDDFTGVAQLILMKFDDDGNAIELSTSTTEQYAASKVFLIPNPANTSVLMKSNYPGSKIIRIANDKGQLVKTVKCDSIDCDLDISRMVEGTYFLLISDERGSYIARDQLVVIR